MQINGFVWDDTVSTADDAKVNDPRNPLLVVLAVLLFAECALLVAATVYLVVELLIATPASLASALFLTVLTGIAAAWLGVELDPAANAAGGPRITTAGSRIAAWVIPTNEELMIARHTRTLVAAGPSG